MRAHHTRIMRASCARHARMTRAHVMRGVMWRACVRHDEDDDENDDENDDETKDDDEDEDKDEDKDEDEDRAIERASERRRRACAGRARGGAGNGDDTRDARWRYPASSASSTPPWPLPPRVRTSERASERASAATGAARTRNIQRCGDVSARARRVTRRVRAC